MTVSRWCMRHGAKLLFALAMLELLVGLIPLVSALLSETGQMAANYGYSPNAPGMPFGWQLKTLFSAISGAAFPFFGALLIDRLDRWLGTRDVREAVQ